MTALVAPPTRAFVGTIHPIGDTLRARMTGRSWRPDPRCPRWDELAYLEVDHVTFDGGVARGEIVVATAVAARALAMFRRLWQIGFPIRRLALIDEFAADDNASMAADNSSGFNFRTIAGTNDLSQHALGRAIDLNPVENPWLRSDRVEPDAGRAYLDRTDIRPGMIVRPGPVVAVFDELGWEWGGDWLHASDNHHVHIRRELPPAGLS